MTGVVPRLGLGTSRNAEPEQCAESVRTALEVGYSHIDTAQEYGNEAYVGDGIAAADVPREDVFLATKVSEKNLAYDDVLESTEESLEKLGVNYVDMLYVHWPDSAYDPEDSLPAFDELRDQGIARNVAVSNFTVDLLEDAQDVLDAPIVANQIEVHPMLPPEEEMVSFCDDHDIDIVAYSPLCRGEALDLPQVTQVAEKHDVSPARAILAWLLAKDLCIIPKAVGADHLRDNYAALDLELDPDDVELIDSVEKRHRKFDRPTAPWH